MRNINCDEILPRSEFISLNDSDYEEQVIRFCNDNLNTYKNNIIPGIKDSLVIDSPVKLYEVFKLNSKNPKIFLLNTNQINYNGDENDKELYYTASAAYKICYNKKILNEDAILGDLEIEAKLKDSKDKLLKQIDEYIESDQIRYNEDVFIFNCLDNTEILKEYNEIASMNTSLEEENELLKNKLKDQEDKIIDLSNKLKISLDNVEESRKQLNITSKSKFEVLMDKLKDILK